MLRMQTHTEAGYILWHLNVHEHKIPACVCVSVCVCVGVGVYVYAYECASAFARRVCVWEAEEYTAHTQRVYVNQQR